MSLIAEGAAATVLHFATPPADWTQQWRYALAHTSWTDHEVDLHAGKRRTERAVLKRDTRGQVQRVTELAPVKTGEWRPKRRPYSVPQFVNESAYRWENPNVLEAAKSPRYYFLNKDYLP